MDRTILHCDLNGFFASVELLSLPHLREKPMAVCGNPENRHGIILAKNEVAKKYGITTAETVWQAKRKCPNLVLVPPHREQYYKYSKLVNEIYQTYTDRVEPFGIDESWLDITETMHLFGGSGQVVANRIRRQVREELGLTISVGVSFNKIFAKLGSDYKKPDATTVITRENYRQMLYPLPVSALLYVGKSSETTLRSMGVRTIGDLAAMDRTVLSRSLGKIGESLYEYANGMDNSEVRFAGEKEEVKSVGNGMTFSRNLEGEADVRAGVAFLTDSVASRLRRAGLKATTVQIQIKNPQFQSISRQKALAHPTDISRELFRAAMELVEQYWKYKDPIRMVTITAMNLVESDFAEQLSLFDNDEQHREKLEKLDAAMDGIRSRFGKGIIQQGRILHNDIGVELKKEKEL